MSSLFDFTKDLPFQDINQIAQISARECGFLWNDDASNILYVSCTPVLSPTLRGKITTPKDAIKTWVNLYFKDYNNRPSKRHSNAPTTHHDSVLDIIIKGRLPHLSEESINNIKWAHRLSMSAENILGLFIEEYLSIKLKPFGWLCAWGSTVKAVDFVNPTKKEYLQVKSRNNTENSSSNKIREGTTIKKWWRFHAQTGTTNWPNLNQLLGLPNETVNEHDFQNFIRNTILNNPKSLAVELHNSWQPLKEPKALLK